MQQTTQASPLSAQQREEKHIRTSDRHAGLCATLLTQAHIINRDMLAIGGSRLEFEILLDVYAAELQGATPCLWDIGSATSLPPSTVHRRIVGMIDRGLLMRLPPSGDRRRVCVQVSPAAKALLEQTFDHLIGRN